MVFGRVWEWSLAQCPMMMGGLMMIAVYCPLTAEGLSTLA
jgi:hypothetical protein